MKSSLLRLAALVIAASLSLTSCAKLPTSSEVKVGSDIQSGLTADYLYYSPSGPAEAATQQEIINGFLNAATGPQNDYAVARQYLSRDLAAKWNPSLELLIGDTRPLVEVSGSTSGQISVKAVARVDSVGRYQDLGAGVTRVLEYAFVEENGQWRISQAPDTIVLVRPVFDVLFKGYSLYFYDNQDRYLVPDLRWFATRVSTSTRLVSALLDGPDGWLAASVNTAFPKDTKLAIDSVIVEDGTAIVDLAASANDSTVAQRQRMLVQLTATLTQLTNVYSVRILIDHVPQAIANLPYQVSLANNPDPIVLTADGFRPLSQTATSMDRASAAAKSWQATDFAINNQQTLLAVLGPLGVGVTRLTGPKSDLVGVDYRGDLLAPAIDVQGHIFTLGSAAESALQVSDPTGKQILVYSSWLARADHAGFAISREGSRLAVLMNFENKKRLFVAAIERDADGVPVSISQPIEIGFTENIVSSVAWIDDTTVATIARSKEGLNYAAYIQVGGEVKRFSPVSNAKSIVANGASSTAYILDNQNELRILRSLTWINFAKGIIAIHFAG